MRLYYDNLITSDAVSSEDTRANFDFVNCIHPFLNKVCVLYTSVSLTGGYFGKSLVLKAVGGLTVAITHGGGTDTTTIVYDGTPVVFTKTTTITAVTITATTTTPIIYNLYSCDAVEIPAPSASRSVSGQYGGIVTITQGYQVANAKGSVSKSYDFSVALTPTQYSTLKDDMENAVGTAGWLEIYDNTFIYGYIPQVPTYPKSGLMYDMKFTFKEAK